MPGVTREQGETERGFLPQAEPPRTRGVVGWFHQERQAEAAIERLAEIGMAARRVQRGTHPAQLEPDRRRWMIGGAIGVVLGAVLGLVAGGMLGSVEAAPPAGSTLFVNAVLGAFIVGSLGLFAGFGFGRDKPRRPQVGTPPGAKRHDGHAADDPPDTVVYVETGDRDHAHAAASRALRDAGAFALEEVAPGAEPPPAARETPAGS